ncbi:hypothetical protein BU25DRAFT_144180 [Macroventuria anomochaeta]|uniref:Uncharacterized protein n=1 Tax=Macroventuria anomochaeta TaxID=301207 RepID=A0ACB6SD39_9PLEO|nr:uncharacterized protein BU25DRAFT_144180 [Macroventuria anomochaeta]KAF2632226.1 hypothetical protein BU25DRAFT_144180 [Macroventuria anomochaeta]
MELRNGIVACQEPTCPAVIREIATWLMSCNFNERDYDPIGWRSTQMMVGAILISNKHPGPTFTDETNLCDCAKSMHNAVLSKVMSSLCIIIRNSCGPCICHIRYDGACSAGKSTVVVDKAARHSGIAATRVHTAHMVWMLVMKTDTIGRT